MLAQILKITTTKRKNNKTPFQWVEKKTTTTPLNTNTKWWHSVKFFIPRQQRKKKTLDVCGRREEKGKKWNLIACTNFKTMPSQMQEWNKNKNNIVVEIFMYWTIETHQQMWHANAFLISKWESLSVRRRISFKSRFSRIDFKLQYIQRIHPWGWCDDTVVIKLCSRTEVCSL